MIRSLRPLLLALSLSAAACSGDNVLVNPRPIEGVAGDLAVQRNMWEGKEIDDYRFAYGRICFCVQQPLAQVTVRDGRIVDVRDIDTGRQLTEQVWDMIPTVDELFAQIAAAQAAGTKLEVTYHPTLGYPVKAVIGELAFDAGVSHMLTGLDEID